MEKDTLSTIKQKNNILYEKLTKMQSYGLNCDDLIKNINTIEKNCSLINKAGNINSGTAVQTQDETMIMSILIFVDKLETFINNIYSCFEIYNLADRFDNPVFINDDMGVDTLDNIVKTFLLYLKKLPIIRTIDEDYDYTDQVYKTIYRIIKEEFRLKGESKLFNHFSLNQNNNKNRIDKLFKADLNNEELSTKVFSSYDTNSQKQAIKKEEELLFLIAINENGFKDKVLKEFKSSKDKYEHLQEDKNDYFHTILKDNSSKKKHQVTKVRNASLGLTSRILSILLTWTIGIGAVSGTISHNRKKYIYDTYMSTKSCYDELDGESTIKEYDTVNVGDITYKLYTPVNEDETRTLKIYSTNDSSIKDAKDAVNYDLNQMTLISENKVVDKELNQLDSDEHVSIKLTTDIDYEDIQKFDSRDAGYYVVMIEINTLIVTIWMVLNYLISANTGILTAFDIFSGNAFDDIDCVLSELRKEISKLRRTAFMYRVSKNEYKRKLKEIDALEKQYDKLYNKYSYLKTILDKEKYTMTLKEE